MNNADMTLSLAGRNYDRTKAQLAVANRQRAAANYTQDSQLCDGAYIRIRDTFKAMNKARAEYRNALRTALR